MTAAFDTNILVYACDKRDPQRQATARSVISAIQTGVLLWQVACEFLAATRKLSDQGFTSKEAWDRLVELLSATPLIIPSFAVLERAHQLQSRYRSHFGMQ